jgi:rsbT co-antagonist protein RsbR
MTQPSRVYEDYFRLAPGLLCIVDGDGRLRRASADLEALLDLQDGGDVSLVELAHADDQARLRGTLAGPGDPSPCELRVRCKGGVYRGFRWSVRAADDGAWFGVLSELADGQERRRFRFLVEAITDMIGIADFTGQTNYINPAGCEMLGYTLDEAMACNIMQYVPAHLHPRYQEEYIPTVMREGKWHGEVEFQRKDGSTFPLTQSIFILTDEQGRPEALATLAHDITNQKRLEEALRQAIDELSTPMIQVWEGVVALPIVGVVDSNRATQMMHSLLDAIQTRRCRIAVIDLTGVKTLDSATVDHLYRMVRAASLLGSRCVLSGMSPVTAQTVAGLGLDLGSILAFRSLEEALRYAMKAIGR